jgi:hypothetical protein
MCLDTSILATSFMEQSEYFMKNTSVYVHFLGMCGFNHVCSLRESVIS